MKSTTVVTAVRGSAFPPAVALRVQFSYFSCALSLRVSFSISSFMIKRRSARISSCARVPILVENGQLLPQLLPCMFSFHTFRIHCHFMFLFSCHVFDTYACSPQNQKIKIKTKHEVLYTYILSWKSWNFSIFGLCQFWNFPFWFHMLMMPIMDLGWIVPGIGSYFFFRIISTLWTNLPDLISNLFLIISQGILLGNRYMLCFNTRKLMLSACQHSEIDVECVSAH